MVMNGRKAKIWITGFLILVIGMLTVVGSWVVRVDPFFHYHKPITNAYYYNLNNQRSQNDGIIKHFDYDALIAGTSMTENFKTSEMDDIFETNSIKVPYSGGSYKEINDTLKSALESNPNLKIIVRGLDMNKFTKDKDDMRLDLGEYPTYLYDNIWYNDVKYIFNRDVIFKRVYPMVVTNKDKGVAPGITSFDDYSNWMARYTFGVKAVCPDGITAPSNTEPVHLSERERDIVMGTIHQNITSLANEYPNVTFYYFFTPYSIAWWRDLVDSGSVYKQIEAEQLIIEEVLKCDNIKLYSFNNLADITTDLNNYKDTLHYGAWINSLMLRYMKDGKGLLTVDNYKEYLDSELSIYTTYDYSQLYEQDDYDNDYYAEAILNYEMNGVEPISILNSYEELAALNQAEIIDDQYNGEPGLQCKGSLLRESESEISVADDIVNSEYVGAEFSIDDISKYRHLVFFGMKNQNPGQPCVYIYDQNNVLLAEFTMPYDDLDNQWHQYMIDVSELTESVTIIFSGGYVDSMDNEDFLYTFSNIILY